MLTNLDMHRAPLDAPTEQTPPTILKFRRPTNGEPALPSPSRAQRLYQPLRRLLDFTLALALTLAALPVVLIVAALVRLTSRGPAFYTQTRIGRGGRPFTIYKIRSMIDKCESLTGPRWTIPGDPRVTPLGWLLRRTHVDELPQLLNVLKGEMSLIGPRPERPEFVNALKKALPGYQDRHNVLPGITGLAQVQLAPDTDTECVRRKLLYDLHQIAHVSLWLDMRIMAATALHMVGVSFELLARLRIVPGPNEVEPPVLPALPEKTPHSLKRAA
jgi:lipopolysaccharide/colanic/teichoic acid biosynthesis glycosyltransferase